jgi:hypothetical protein
VVASCKLQIAARINLIKNISPTPPNARDDQPRTSVPQLPLRRSVDPPGRGPLHLRIVIRTASQEKKQGPRR